MAYPNMHIGMLILSRDLMTLAGVSISPASYEKQEIVVFFNYTRVIERIETR